MGRGKVWALRELGAPENSPAIDFFRTETAGRHAVRLLNDGLARLEPHHPPGCRVQPVYAPRDHPAA